MHRVIGAMAKFQDTVNTWNYQLAGQEKTSIERTQKTYKDRVENNAWQSWTTMFTGAGAGILKIVSGVSGDGLKPLFEGASEVFGKSGEVYQIRLRGSDIQAEGDQNRHQRDAQFAQEMIRTAQSAYDRFAQNITSMQSTKSQQGG